MSDLCAKSRFIWSERPEDLSMPPPPRTGYLDRASGEWVLSRYSDVLAVLHDSRLEPQRHQSTEQRERDEQARRSVRSATQKSLSLSQLSEWQLRIKQLAYSRMAELPVNRSVDLVAEFAEPWCTSVALIVTGAEQGGRERLFELARRVSAAAADPDNPDLKTAAEIANSELERHVPADAIPMASAAFVALAQTLPAFLARAWLALMRHPSELSSLHGDPELMPQAIEELLRYAGPARKIMRVAHAPLDLAAAPIAPGEKVRLLLDSANRDPEQFKEPNRLDPKRRAVRHLALGAGPHSCAGGTLIRMAAAVATTAFVQKFHRAAVREPVEWRGGVVFRAPAVLFVGWR
jgi:cytochrome P450